MTSMCLWCDMIDKNEDANQAFVMVWAPIRRNDLIYLHFICVLHVQMSTNKCDHVFMRDSYTHTCIYNKSRSPHDFFHGNCKWTNQNPPHHQGQPLSGLMAAPAMTWQTLIAPLTITIEEIIRGSRLISITYTHVQTCANKRSLIFD